MKGHLEDEFAKEVDLSKKKVYVAPFSPFPTSIHVDVCQRTHAKCQKFAGTHSLSQIMVV